MQLQAAIFSGSRGTRRGGSEAARLTPLRQCKLKIGNFGALYPIVIYFPLCLLVLDNYRYFSYKPELSFDLHIYINANHENNLLLMTNILHHKKKHFLFTLLLFFLFSFRIFYYLRSERSERSLS